MSFQIVSRTLVLSTAIAAVLSLGAFAPPALIDTAHAQSLTGAVEDMTPEEKEEREGRKACRVAICAALHNRKAGPDVSCDITKSWRKVHLDAIVGKAGVSWPWGRVVCKAPLKLKRDVLIKALDGTKSEADIGTHAVVCEVERGTEPKAEIKAEFSPKVVFEGGKAVKATLNWGKIDAPTLVKGAMWTATATDNTFNVLQSMVVEDINRFTTTGCDEVKADWQGK